MCITDLPVDEIKQFDNNKSVLSIYPCESGSIHSDTEEGLSLFSLHESNRPGSCDHTLQSWLLKEEADFRDCHT